MARKDAMQLQAEINSDDEWNALLTKSGLLVVDVYCEWSGPCAAMVNLLRKIKMEIGGDLLSLAIANCDKIEALKRFRGNCEPTWLFISAGGLVNLMFGANAPQLRRVIVDELETQASVEAGTMRRHPIPWDKLTDEEQRREDIRIEEEQRKQNEKEEMERAAAARRLDRIGWALHNCTLLIYLPFTWDPNESTVPAHDEVAKLLEDDLFVRETIKIDLDPIVACELFYGGVPEKVTPPPEEEEGEEAEGAEEGAEAPRPRPPPPPSPPPLKEKAKRKSKSEPVPEEGAVEAAEVEVERCPPAELVEALCEGKTFVHYAEALSPAVEEGQLPPPPEDIICKVARAVYGCEAPHEGHPQQIDPESVAARYARSELVPAVWTPTTVLTKMDALERLFPQKMQRFHRPPVPPHMAVAFEATRYRELAPALKDNQEAILELAFFSSADALTAKRIANNYREYVLAPGKTGDEKLIIQLDTTKKVPLLNMAALGPSYFSLSPEEGIQDCEYFFPQKEETFEEEEEEEDKEEGEGEEEEEEEEDEAFLAAEAAALRGEEPPSAQVEEEAKEGEEEGLEEEEGTAAAEGTAPVAPEGVAASEGVAAPEEGTTPEGGAAPVAEGGAAPVAEGGAAPVAEGGEAQVAEGGAAPVAEEPAVTEQEVVPAPTLVPEPAPAEPTSEAGNGPEVEATAALPQEGEQKAEGEAPPA